MLDDVHTLFAMVLQGFLVLVAQYEAQKTAFSAWVGIDDWLLHAQSGMAAFLLAAIVSRRSLGAWLPVTTVFLAEAVNEWFDRLSFGSWQWQDTSRDVAFTLIWPLLLFLFTQTGLLRRYD